MLYKVFNMRDVKYKKTVVLMDRDVVVLIKRVVKDEGKYSFSQKGIKNRFSLRYKNLSHLDIDDIRKIKEIIESKSQQDMQ